MALLCAERRRSARVRIWKEGLNADIERVHRCLAQWRETDAAECKSAPSAVRTRHVHTRRAGLRAVAVACARLFYFTRFYCPSLYAQKTITC
eukprot:scaffold46838_cov77-Phaeocystis_antarctica.AAC.2